MPYLSKIRINPRRPAALRLLGNPHRMHGAVQAGLPNADGERVLWRLDADNPHRPHLLVLTQHTRPDWTHLVEQAGWPTADGEHILVRDYTPLLQRLAAGQHYAFRLKANPVQNTKRPDKATDTQHARLQAAEQSGTRMRSFRIGHRTANTQLAWLLKRTEKPETGFALPQTMSGPDPAPGLEPPSSSPPAPAVALTQRDTQRFSTKPNGTPKILSTATFEGRLRVTDPDALRRTLLAGIGPSKAYGCGLLTLAPLPQEHADG